MTARLIIVTWQTWSLNAVLFVSKRWGIPLKEVRPNMTRAMQQMHALWCFFIYESLDQTWGLHVDYGVLVAACFVVFLTLSKKKKKTMDLSIKNKFHLRFCQNLVWILHRFREQSKFLCKGEAIVIVVSVVYWQQSVSACVLLEISAWTNWTFWINGPSDFQVFFIFLL